MKQASPAETGGQAWWSGALAFGPGLVFLLSSIGPSDLVSNSAAGANYGYNLIWTLAVCAIARYLILEATARYVLVTGESLLTGYRRAGRWVVWLILALIVVKRHLSNLYHILLLGISVHLMIPLPTTRSATIWSVIFCTLGFALMYWGRYPMVEKLSRPLLFALGGSLVMAAIIAKPDTGALLDGLIHPSLPVEGSHYSPALLLLALLGTTIGTVGILKYSAFVYEKGWRDLSHLKLQRADLFLGVAGAFIISAIIQIASAATLKPLGFHVENIEDLVPMFASVLGQSGRILLGIGLWATVFTTYVGSNMGYSLMASDIYEQTFGRTLAHGSKDQSYRWFLIWFCISPMYVLLTDWKPVPLVLLSALLFVLVLPLLVGVLLRLTNDKQLMGAHTNGWVTNVLLTLFVMLTIYLAYQNGLEFWHDLTDVL